jgi:predicted alpha/beta hydrolase
MKLEACFCDLCGVQWKNERGLIYHKQRSFRHNINKYDNPAKNFLNENSKQISIPCAKSEENEDDNLVKKKSKSQYVDIDKLESRIDSEYGDHDHDHDHGGSDYEVEEDFKD